MDFLDVKLNKEQHRFDWDDISVGNIHLDHSQNFFTIKHYEHERIEEIEFLQQKMVETEISSPGKNKTTSEEKENTCKLPSPDGIQNDGNKISTFASPDRIQNDGNKTSTFELPNGVQNNENKTSKFASSNGIKNENKTSVLKMSNTKITASTDVLQDKLEKSHKVAPNLACEWSTKKTICSQDVLSKGAVSKHMPPPPQAYLIKDIYKRNREEAKLRRLEEERKQREFRSRPAPNFNSSNHGQKSKLSHIVTMPVTPKVLKTSKEAEEKRKKKLEELKQKNQPPKFESRPPTVLKEKPFVPKKTTTLVQQCPFNLRMEKRLQERKYYDETKQKALEEKQKQAEIEEEKRKRLEKENIKALRKAATFKARPNPFKN